ncbi:MAG: ATPase domain-containing protein [Anaerolineales bacterium]|nr:ATPase domain-containing protein [Anaerolineales bacterium]
MTGPQSISSNVIPTGSLNLDLAMDWGGLPRGRIVEIFGAESTGKSTLAFHILAEAQQSGLRSVYIDVTALPAKAGSFLGYA